MDENNKSLFLKAKEAFLDRVDPEAFVRLESNIPLLEKLHSLRDEKFKIAILKGEPGIGKSMLLKRFWIECESDDVLLLERPFFDLQTFERQLKARLGIETPSLFDGLHQYAPYSKMILLDEAQLYSKELLEYIRILADSEKLKFLLTLHTITQENPLVHEHFRTRIHTELQLTAPSSQELGIYIQKRLFRSGCSECAQALKPKHAKSIHRYTGGNLRKSNKFLYTLFDILHYFEQNHPTKIPKSLIDTKFLEMTAIHLGYIDA